MSPSERGDVVALSGTDLDNHDIDVADYRGKPVVVVVWGSWCTPCRAEAPDVVAAANELGEKAQFLGINIRDASTDQAKGFVRTFDVPYPSVFSPKGDALLALRGTVTPNSIPSFVVLDGEGRVAASIIGELPSTQTLVDVVADVVQEPARDSTGSAHG